jgi:hypothetical protein
MSCVVLLSGSEVPFDMVGVLAWAGLEDKLAEEMVKN